MIEWFLALDKGIQTTLISSIVSSVVVGIVAVLGFWITFRTSIAANREIVEMSKSLRLDELKHQSRIKIADFRMDWIDSLRRDLAGLYKIQYEIASLRKKKAASRTQEEAERLRRLYFESSELKARILLRIKQDSDDPNERRLEQVLKRSVSADPDKAQDQRKEIRELTRAILKAEWRRVRVELENVS